MFDSIKKNIYAHKRKRVLYKLNGNFFHCPMDIAMDYVSGKWKCVILIYMKNKTLRFNEISKLIPDITEKTLSLQLKYLEKKGLIRKEIAKSKPPSIIKYSLTDFGKTLIPAIDALAEWGQRIGDAHGEIVAM